MRNPLDNPLLLLLGTGSALAVIAPLGKIALESGFNPFVWASLIALFPSLTLWWFAAREGPFWRDPVLWRYGAVGGTLANVIPSSILLLAIPHTGSGLAGLMFALSPVATAAISLAFRVRPPSGALLIAVALGFAGAIIVVSGGSALAMPTAPQWLLLSLLVPCSLAIGNVYRTAKWPKGATPLQIAVVVNMSAAPFLAALAIWQGGSWSEVFAHPALVLAQWLASIVNVALFFRLQWISGPTFLSQIGYVAAAISLGVGSLALGESYPWQVWLGASLIIGGFFATAYEAHKNKPV